MANEGDLSVDALALLRALSGFRGRAASGEELMERIFATTSEISLDPPKVCLAVEELVACGFATVERSGPRDPAFDFVSMAITRAGQSHLVG